MSGIVLILWLYFTVTIPKQLEVLLINVLRVLKRNDLPHKHADLKVTDVHNMNVHFPLFGYVCAL